jgi:hypothetical protein
VLRFRDSNLPEPLYAAMDRERMAAFGKKPPRELGFSPIRKQGYRDSGYRDLAGS